ncbi:hypothetical protein [Roseovarius gaetbuli]|uniref:hypothetical protein n=1 Tax=Roseovarius gaetbuli TaxID=1356575 RepID=UPI00148383F8|nr:hypothetical protein [Roseovarius gaetbuli]
MTQKLVSQGGKGKRQFPDLVIARNPKIKRFVVDMPAHCIGELAQWIGKMRADDPRDTDGKKNQDKRHNRIPNQHLVRRRKKGVARHFRHHIKAKGATKLRRDNRIGGHRHITGKEYLTQVSL